MGPVINSQLAILHSQLLQNEMGTVLTLLFSRFDVVDYTNNLINPKYNYDELQHLVVICDDGYLMSYSYMLYAICFVYYVFIYLQVQCYHPLVYNF